VGVESLGARRRSIPSKGFVFNFDILNFDKFFQQNRKINQIYNIEKIKSQLFVKKRH
jgi:hypothetical protein